MEPEPPTRPHPPGRPEEPPLPTPPHYEPGPPSPEAVASPADRPAASGPRRRRLLRPVAAGIGLFLLVQLVAAAASEPLDLDGDGLSALRERDAGTDPDDPDSDGDRLSDGWEGGRGLDPTKADTEGDGLGDGEEVALGSNPLAADTDGDGIPDDEESAGESPADCDGDGVLALLETDDDADGRPDGEEPAAHRCDRDVDDDEVPDGEEGNGACVVLADCDADGVPDGEERKNGFDPLDPDTFDVNLPDAVSLAFQRAGAPAGRDDDRDGIPDPWENATGLIDWGPFHPRAGSADLLVEFVRVLGPDSARYASLNLGPAYAKLRSFFAAEGVTLQWVETQVLLPGEPLPAILPTRSEAYYREVLDKAAHTANPFVLTVVVNPQLDQSAVLHAGIAPLRGMLAAVDLSLHVDLHFRDADDTLKTTVSPFAESLIRAGRAAELGVAGGIREDGSYFLVLSGGELRWTPFWLRNPVAIPTGGSPVALVDSGRTVHTDPLASVLLHEMGHTLGLCHAHEAACQAGFSAEDRARADESTMSYAAPQTALFFLPSEWERVRSFLTCPPPEPIRLLSEAVDRGSLLDAKYTYALGEGNETGFRECQDLVPLQRTLEPLAGSAYEAPSGMAAPPDPGHALGPVLWDGGFLAAGAVAGLLLGRRLRPPASAKMPNLIQQP